MLTDTWILIGARVSNTCSTDTYNCIKRLVHKHLEQSATQHSWLDTVCGNIRNTVKNLHVCLGRGAGVFELAPQKCTLRYDTISTDVYILGHWHFSHITLWCNGKTLQLLLLKKESQVWQQSGILIISNHRVANKSCLQCIQQLEQFSNDRHSIMRLPYNSHKHLTKQCLSRPFCHRIQCNILSITD